MSENEKKVPLVDFYVNDQNIRAKIETDEGLRVNIEVNWDTLKNFFMGLTGDEDGNKHRARK